MNDDIKDDIKVEAKELSSNPVLRFFQKIYRSWMIIWYKFSNKHPSFSKLLFRIGMFWVFSVMVTLLQYIIMTFLPYAFKDLAGVKFIWPEVTIDLGGSFKPFTWSLLGYDVVTNADGEVIIGGGLGFFIAYELATFIAQCINFPLQRNITYKSHGNVGYQMMWYFIAWIVISLICNAIDSFWIGWASQFMNPAVYNVLTTVITGGVSMVIFFFVFMIIFPDLDKVAKNSEKRLANAKANGADSSKLRKLEEAYEKAKKDRDLANARKDVDLKTKQADSKCIQWQAAVKMLEEAKKENKPETDIKACEELIALRYQEAYQALVDKKAAEKALAQL